MQRGAAGVETTRLLCGCCGGDLRGVDGKMLVHEVACLAPQKFARTSSTLAASRGSWHAGFRAGSAASSPHSTVITKAHPVLKVPDPSLLFFPATELVVATLSFVTAWSFLVPLSPGFRPPFGLLTSWPGVSDIPGPTADGPHRARPGTLHLPWGGYGRVGEGQQELQLVSQPALRSKGP